MGQKILLVTTENRVSAARLAGAFSMLGAGVEAFFPHRHVLGVCRYLDRAYHYRPRHVRQSLAEVLKRSAPDCVIPCDDRALALLLDLDEFAPLLERSLGPRQNLSMLMARATQIAAARQAGIAAPQTLAVPDFAALPYAVAEVGLPCMMRTDRGGAVLVDSPRQAARAFRKLRRARSRGLMGALLEPFFPIEAREAPAISVQAFITGKPATSAFAARNGKVVAVLHADVSPNDRIEILRHADCLAMDDAARKIAARFDLSGLYGLDFICGREPHLIAVHPHPTDICHLALGPDLPAALLGKPARPPVTSRRQIARFPQLLGAPPLPRSVYCDIPWDDPAVLRAVSGDALPEAQGLELIAEFMRPTAAAPVFRREPAASGSNRPSHAGTALAGRKCRIAAQPDYQPISS